MSLRFRSLPMFCLAALTLATPAQTLAHPGWAGSGLRAEPWWRNAVFYRVDVSHFQDSDGDGRGDLTGLATRMDYIQSLGADAVVLMPGFDHDGPEKAGFDEAGFDRLRREANGRHIRIIAGLNVPGQSAFSPDATGLDAAVLAAARLWLTRGAAGISLGGAAAGTPPSPTLVRALRALIDTFPGERTLSVTAAPEAAAEPLTRRKPFAPLLVETQITSGSDALAEELAAGSDTGEGGPVLESDARFRSANAFYEEDRAEQLGRSKILAAVLLSFRGAVSLRYGQELGLAAEAGGAAPETMQWTPGNVTPPAPDTLKSPPDPTVFGPYVPYVKPQPQPTPPRPGESAPVAPDSLRGFTSGTLPAENARSNRRTANVALEDSDPGSLLNFYRRLVQLHHGNPALRDGTPQVLHDITEGAAATTLVWVRRAPAGTRTAGDVVLACNLGDKPLHLSVTADLRRLRLAGGALRPLLASWPQVPAGQSTDAIVLPPYSVFLGELPHGAR